MKQDIKEPLRESSETRHALKDKTLKSIFLAVGIITGFVFIVAFSSLYVADAIKNNDACGCVIPIPYMILLLSSLGVFVGSFASYFVASKYARERSTRIKSLDFTLNFLSPDERRILKEVIKEKQGLRQSQLEKRTGMHKVKVHRTVQKLKSKDVVHIKDSKVKLDNNLRTLFKCRKPRD